MQRKAAQSSARGRRSRRRKVGDRIRTIAAALMINRFGADGDHVSTEPLIVARGDESFILWPCALLQQPLGPLFLLLLLILLLSHIFCDRTECFYTEAAADLPPEAAIHPYIIRRLPFDSAFRSPARGSLCSPSPSIFAPPPTHLSCLCLSLSIKRMSE